MRSFSLNTYIQRLHDVHVEYEDDLEAVRSLSDDIICELLIGTFEDAGIDLVIAWKGAGHSSVRAYLDSPPPATQE